MVNRLSTPWAVLLCKFKDNQSETPVPNFRTVCERFFTTPGAGFNAVQFFSDMSHGSLDLSGSQVLGWFTLDVNVNDVVAPTDPPPPGWTPKKSQNDMMALAKQAATNAGVPLNTFFGVVLIMNVATGAAQGGYNWPGVAPARGVFADWRRVDGRLGDGSLGPRGTGGGNGTEVFGQEMGHGYGLGHSRRDGSNADYQDCWDIMSTDNNCSVADPDYCARGPGLNAWNMRGRGWLDESRVWRGPSGLFDQVIQLSPLHRRDLNGWLAAELPPNDREGGHGQYLVEFRIKEAWDAGIPRSAVLVHRFLTAAQDNDGWPHSYIMSGTNGNQDLAEGDVSAPWGGGGPRLEVQKIDENAKVATVRLSYAPPMTDVAPAVAGVGNNVYFFAKSLNGRILYNRAQLGQAGLGWVEMEGDGRISSAPAAAAVGTHVFVAARGLDGNLYLNQADLGNPFGQWFPMDFITDAAPAVAGVGNNVYFFAKRSDGRVFYNRAVLGQAGLGWTEVDGNGLISSAPAAAGVGTHVFVAARGLDGNLYLNQADLGGPFNNFWSPMDFITDVAPAVAAVGNNVYFFAKRSDGRVFYNRAVLGQAGLGWTEVDGNGLISSAPAAAGVGTHVFVAARGLDGNLYLNQADLGNPFGQWFLME